MRLYTHAEVVALVERAVREWNVNDGFEPPEMRDDPLRYQTLYAERIISEGSAAPRDRAAAIRWFERDAVSLGYSEAEAWRITQERLGEIDRDTP